MQCSYQQKLSQVSPIKAWFVVVVVSMFFFFEFGLGNVFNTLTPAILDQYKSLNEVNVSFISSLYFYANIIFILPAAYIMDRYSTKAAICTALVLCVLSIVIFTLTDNVYALAISRIIMGIGGSFSLIGCVRIATNWFPAQKLGFVIGVIIAIGMLGGYAAQAPLNMLLQATGLKFTLLVVSLVGTAILLMLLLFVRNTPKALDGERQSQIQSLQEAPLWSTLKVVLSKSQNWYCGIYVGLINIGTWMLGGMWSNKYLGVSHGISVTQAAAITGFIFLGMIFAYPFWGWFSEKLQRRRLPLVLGGAFSVVIILIIMFTKPSITVLSVLFFSLGFATSAQTIAYPIVGETNPMKNNAVATGIVSMNSLFWGGVIAIPLFGLLTKWVNTSFAGGADAAIGYNFSMGILLVGFLLSIVFAFLIKETYCKRQVE